MGTDGATDGASISEVQLHTMNEFFPGWHTETQAATVEHYSKTDLRPTEFYVYPPNTGTGYVLMEYAATPATTTYDVSGDWQNETIPVSDEYSNALINGILTLANNEDSDLPGNIERSQLHDQRYDKKV